MASLLLENGAEVDKMDNSGRTPLHLAAVRRSSSKIIIILLKKRAQVNLKDNSGKTPLHYAAMEGPVVSELSS